MCIIQEVWSLRGCGWCRRLRVVKFCFKGTSYSLVETLAVGCIV